MTSWKNRYFYITKPTGEGARFFRWEEEYDTFVKGGGFAPQVEKVENNFVHTHCGLVFPKAICTLYPLSSKRYRDSLKACALQVGDTVKLIYRHKEGERGVSSLLSPSDLPIGTIGAVTEVDIDNGHLVVEFGDDGFFVPHFTVEKFSPLTVFDGNVERRITFEPGQIRIGCQTISNEKVRRIAEQLVE